MSWCNPKDKQKQHKKDDAEVTHEHCEIKDKIC